VLDVAGCTSSLAESGDFELRFVPLLAAVCCCLLHPKGKTRATSQDSFLRATPIEYLLRGFN
jgi:hypothetical protein